MNKDTAAALGFVGSLIGIGVGIGIALSSFGLTGGLVSGLLLLGKIGWGIVIWVTLCAGLAWGLTQLKTPRWAIYIAMTPWAIFCAQIVTERVQRWLS